MLDSQISSLNLQLILYNQISCPYCYISSAIKMATAVLPLLKGLIAITYEVLWTTSEVYREQHTTWITYPTPITFFHD